MLSITFFREQTFMFNRFKQAKVDANAATNKASVAAFGLK